MAFTDLPHDELVSVLEHLAFRDLCRVLAVSSGLRAVAIGEPSLWARCTPGVCDGRLTDSVLQRYTSYARGHLTHVQVINAYSITTNALLQAAAGNQLQSLDLRGCIRVDVDELLAKLERPGDLRRATCSGRSARSTTFKFTSRVRNVRSRAAISLNTATRA